MANVKLCVPCNGAGRRKGELKPCGECAGSGEEPKKPAPAANKPASPKDGE